MIIKKTFTTLLIIFVYLGINAQDIMITKDGRKISAKVEEIGIEVVKYKKVDNQSGPSYLMNKSDIASILFENGDFEVFKEEIQRKPIKQKSVTSNYQKAKTLRNAGIGLTFGGLGVAVGGLGCYLAMSQNTYKYTALQAYGMYKGGIAMMAVGSSISVAGIICAVTGETRMKGNGGFSLLEIDKLKLNMDVGVNNFCLILQF